MGFSPRRRRPFVEFVDRTDVTLEVQRCIIPWSVSGRQEAGEDHVGLYAESGAARHYRRVDRGDLPAIELAHPAGGDLRMERSMLDTS